MIKWPVQKQTHRTAQNTKTQHTFRINYFYVFGCFYCIYDFLNVSPRNVKLPHWYVNDFYRGFKQAEMSHIQRQRVKALSGSRLSVFFFEMMMNEEY